jgi:hypothetical protein
MGLLPHEGNGGSRAKASLARRPEPCWILVERVVFNDRVVEGIVWTPPGRPLFFAELGAGAWYPQPDSNR